MNMDDLKSKPTGKLKSMITSLKVVAVFLLVAVAVLFYQGSYAIAFAEFAIIAVMFMSISRINKELKLRQDGSADLLK